jgi:[ribosomal protein S18]-alanine N-acetyltransferase
MIRLIKTTDIFQIAELEETTLGQSLGTEFLLQEIMYNPYAYYIVYELNQEVIGYLGYRLHENMAEMMNFVIKQEYQNQEFGTQLIEESFKHFKANHIKTITLEVRKNNQKARRFYEKQGFSVSHIKKNYYDKEDAVVYLKEVLE